MAEDQDPRPPSRADAVRSAVDQALQATVGQGGRAAESTRERAQDIVDELGQAAGRLQRVLEDLRPPTGEELRALRERIETLEERVSALESERSTGPETER